jgi:hypothetical protein
VRLLPSPVSVGGDSIGATIQVDSPAPEFALAGEGRRVQGQAGAFYRSNGDGMGLNLSATYATEQMSLRYDGSTAEADNYKAARDFKAAGPAASDKPAQWLGGDEVGSSSYKTRNHSLAYAFRSDEHLVDAPGPAGHPLPELSQPAHGHDGQRQPPVQPALPGPVPLGPAPGAGLPRENPPRHELWRRQAVCTANKYAHGHQGNTGAGQGDITCRNATPCAWAERATPERLVDRFGTGMMMAPPSGTSATASATA